jgi:hypothetical protein
VDDGADTYAAGHGHRTTLKHLLVRHDSVSAASGSDAAGDTDGDGDGDANATTAEEDADAMTEEEEDTNTDTDTDTNTIIAEGAKLKHSWAGHGGGTRQTVAAPHVAPAVAAAPSPFRGARRVSLKSQLGGGRSPSPSVSNTGRGSHSSTF